MSHDIKKHKTNSSSSNNTTWIAVDWGTSRLRVWHMSNEGEILNHRSCEQGMNNLQPSDFEAVLLSQIEPWLTVDSITKVLACGMLGSRQGWMEVSYATAPCLAATKPMQVITQDNRIDVHICPGIKQPSPADVMRGEETQVAGFIASQPNFNGVICLPGTHAKWVLVENSQVMHFQTFLTGELYALLAKQSVLRHSINTDQWDEQAFATALKQSIDMPQSISAKLFSLRAEALLNDLNAGSANAALSGYLIGLELASSKHLWEGQQIIIIGESTLAQRYTQALNLCGITSDLQNSEQLTLQGLAIASHQV